MINFEKKINDFKKYLVEQEKAENTVEKYVRDVKELYMWLKNVSIVRKVENINSIDNSQEKIIEDEIILSMLTKEIVIKYKEYLKEKHKDKIASINSKISSLNTFFIFIERQDLILKIIKCQKSLFGSKEKELTKDDITKLLNACRFVGTACHKICRGDNLSPAQSMFISKNFEFWDSLKEDCNKYKQERLYYLIVTMISTGIRVSEVKFITVDAVNTGKVIVDNKGKVRLVHIPSKLCKLLKEYCKKYNIHNGSIFITRNGKPLGRTYIWAMLKSLCKVANVDAKKVFPHNLRHFFAKEFYKETKDIVKLATILGHSSIETTKIYTLESEEEVFNMIEKIRFIKFERIR